METTNVSEPIKINVPTSIVSQTGALSKDESIVPPSIIQKETQKTNQSREGGSMEPAKQQVNVAKIGRPAPRLGKVCSRQNHPVTISYGAESIVIAPRGTIRRVNPEMLGALPTGVVFAPGE